MNLPTLKAAALAAKGEHSDVEHEWVAKGNLAAECTPATLIELIELVEEGRALLDPKNGDWSMLSDEIHSRRDDYLAKLRAAGIEGETGGGE